MMQPLMSPAEIRRFERVLAEQAMDRETLNILEWGSGGSTAYFTDFLRRQDIPYTWTSIEYNRAWHERVSKEVSADPHTKVVLIDVGNNDVRQRNIPMNEYVDYPSTLGQKFDIVFVDGRKRRRCMLAAKNILSEGGVAIVHDAERRYYWRAFAAYPRGYFVEDRMFMGQLGEASLAEQVVHYVSFMRPCYYMLRTLAWKLKELALGRNQFLKK